MAKRYFTTDKIGDTVEVDQELARQLVAQGKKTPADFEIEDDGQPAAPAPATTAPPKEVGSLEAIAPSFLSASQGGQGYAGRTWGAAKDLLSLPLRTVAGAGSALGTALGGGSIDESGRAFMGGMSGPVESAQEAYGSTPEVQKLIANPLMYAGMAQDPKTLPLSALAALPVNGVGQGLAMGLTSYAERQADALASVQRASKMPSLSDLAPAALGAAGEAAIALPGVGGRLQEGAKALIRAQIKTSSKKGGIVGKGLEQGLDAGYLPTIAGRGTLSVPQMEKNFDKVFLPTQQEFTPTLRAMDAAGVKVSTNRAADAAQTHLADYIAGGGVIPAETQGRNALDWFRQRVVQPDNAQDVSKVLSGYREPAQRGPTIATPVDQTITPGFVAPGPMVGKVGVGRTADQIIPGPMVGVPGAASEVPTGSWVMVGGQKRWIEGVPQAAQEPGSFRQLPGERIPGQEIQAQTGFKQLPGEYVLPKLATVGGGYKELIPGVQPAPQDVLIGPSAAHFRKSGILKEAFKNPETATANSEVAMGGGMNLRQQLIAGGVKPTAEAIAAGQQYQDLLQRSAPLYAMEAAMRQAGQRANRYPLSLYSALKAPVQMVQELPATARWMYDAGGLAKRVNPAARAVTPFAPAAPTFGALLGMGVGQ